MNYPEPYHYVCHAARREQRRWLQALSGLIGSRFDQLVARRAVEIWGPVECWRMWQLEKAIMLADLLATRHCVYYTNLDGILEIGTVRQKEA